MRMSARCPVWHTHLRIDLLLFAHAKYSSGAPFQWAAIFHKSDIKFLNGHDGLDFFKAAGNLREHNLPCKILCSHCHSPIMDEGRNMVLLFPELIDYGEGERKQEFLKLFAPK